jgi:hypothetical protein
MTHTLHLSPAQLYSTTTASASFFVSVRQRSGALFSTLFQGVFKNSFIGMSGEEGTFSETQAYSSVCADSDKFSDAVNRPRKEIFRDAHQNNPRAPWQHASSRRDLTEFPPNDHNHVDRCNPC